MSQQQRVQNVRYPVGARNPLLDKWQVTRGPLPKYSLYLGGCALLFTSLHLYLGSKAEARLEKDYAGWKKANLE